jgi:hypothetical protein
MHDELKFSLLFSVESVDVVYCIKLRLKVALTLPMSKSVR